MVHFSDDRVVLGRSLCLPSLLHIEYLQHLFNEDNCDIPPVPLQINQTTNYGLVTEHVFNESIIDVSYTFDAIIH